MKKELKPFFTRKQKPKKMKAMNGFDYLIGKKCSYQAEDRDFECEIIGFNYITEDKWPYGAYVTIHLKPLDSKSIAKDDLHEMWQGVALDSISGIDN